MRISQLNLLIALDKYGSFSRAAKELFISQPSISVAIKELETELGFQLLERNSKGIAFTPQGEIVLQKAQTIVNEMDAIYQLRDNTSIKGLSKKLKLVAAPFFCNTILNEALTIVKKENVAFEFDLRHANGGDILKIFSLEQADIGIILTALNNEADFVSEIQKNNLEYFTLYTSELCYLVRKDHPLCELKQVTLTDILKYPLVFQFSSLLDLMLSDYRHRGYTGRPMIVENMSVLLRYLSISDAVTPFIAQIFQNASYNTSSLKALYPIDYPMPCKILCVYTKEIATFAEAYFLDVLVKACRIFQ